MHKEEGLDFSKVVSFNLDEYVGIATKSPGELSLFYVGKFIQSYKY